jgi:hypothetical protein
MSTSRSQGMGERTPASDYGRLLDWMQSRRGEAGSHNEDLEVLETHLDSLRRRAGRAQRGSRVAALYRQLAQAQMAVEQCRSCDFSREIRGLLVTKIRLVEAELASLLANR